MENREQNNAADLRWFAMRATFRREMTVKHLLDDRQVENYIPMQEVIKVSRGRRVKLKEPAIHNLIFVRWQKDAIQEFKSRVPFLQYMTRRENNRSLPITVSDKEMTAFIRVSSDESLNPEYYDSDEFLKTLPTGARVRIHGGVLDGVEGSYVKIKGRRNRRVVVSVSNVASVATAMVRPEMIEVISGI